MVKNNNAQKVFGKAEKLIKEGSNKKAKIL